MTRTESRKGDPTTRPATLSARLNKGLVSYVAAAGAAGAGMLAGAQPADAEVVYTPANTPILINVPVALDLNNDGSIDFQLSNNYRAFARKSCTQNCSFGANAVLQVNPAQAENAIWAIDASSHRTDRMPGKAKITKEGAAPVFFGVLVGPGRRLDPIPEVMHSEVFSGTIFGFASYRSFGPWGKQRPFIGPYLGLKFMVGGEVHYGWARIAVQADLLTIKATLTGYAYETVPNRPIITGITHGTFDGSMETDPAAPGETAAADPATLGRLALGAEGLPAWRVSRVVAQNAAPAVGN